MEIKYGENLNTFSLGGIVIPTITSLALVCSAFEPSITTNIYQYDNAPENYSQIQDWRKNLNLQGFQSTGGDELFQKDIDNYLKLLSFGNVLLSEMEDVPPEFEKTFKENYWDLLA